MPTVNLRSLSAAAWSSLGQYCSWLDEYSETRARSTQGLEKPERTNSLASNFASHHSRVLESSSP